MYFLPKNNFFYSYLINLNSYIRYFLVFFILASFFCCWFFVFFTKLKNQQLNLINNIEELKAKEESLNEIKKSIKDTLLEVQDINSQTDLIINNHYKTENNNFNLLIKNARDLNLVVTSLNFDDYIAKQSYAKSIITFNFKGEFEKVIQFFKTLAFSDNWLKFKKINISSSLDNEIKVESICKFYLPQKGLRCSAKEFSLNVL